MSSKTSQDALLEARRRAKSEDRQAEYLRKAAMLIALLFLRQLAFVQDPHRFKALLCPRRAGKTFAAAVYLLYVCLTKPGASVLYITLTRGTAKLILWPILEQLNERFDLGIKLNNVELTAKFANGSKLQLTGAETLSDIEKFRGRPFNLIIVDESKSFAHALLDAMIEDVLTPCLLDRRGTLVMMGTPGYIFAGAFYEATGPTSTKIEDEEGRDGKRRARSRPYEERDLDRWQDTTWSWSSHAWTMQDNTACVDADGNPIDLWATALADRALHGWTDDNPKWVREYLGRWCQDDGEFAVHYSPERNGWTPKNRETAYLELPAEHEWRFGLGSDLGFDNEFSIQVFAYSSTCQDFYHCYEFSAPDLHPSAWAAEYKRTFEKIGFEHFDFLIADRGGLGKAIVAEMERVHGINLEAADKHQKTAHIEIWDGELKDGRCKIMRGSRLEGELMSVPWADKRRLELAEDIPHDNFEAALYTVTRMQHHFASMRPAAPPKPGTPEWDRKHEEDELRAIEAAEARRHEADAYGEDIDLDRPSRWERDAW